MKKEIPYIHLIRVIACMMVVALHTLPPKSMFTIDNSIDNIWISLTIVLTKPCVPLFFMITGCLILPYQENESLDFYKKRIPRVLYPLLIWGLLYAVLPYVLGIQEPDQTLNELLISPLVPPSKIGGILWYLFMLIGLYLFLPYLTSKVYTDKKMLQQFLVFWMQSSATLLFIEVCPTLLGRNIYEHDFTMLLNFTGYLGYILLGYYLFTYNNDLTKKSMGGDFYC